MGDLANTNGIDLSSYENALVGGDLAALSSAERLSYYQKTCESMGLNPLTKPFEYIRLNGKLVLYANKGCAEQLRKIHGVSIRIEKVDVPGCVAFRAIATDRTGRTDESIGCVPIDGLKGEQLSNAIMRCEQKAKRRVSLSICSAGVIDETEVGSIKGARPVLVTADGEILDDGLEAQLRASVNKVVHESGPDVEGVTKSPDFIVQGMVEECNECKTVAQFTSLWKSAAFHADYVKLPAEHQAKVKAHFAGRKAALNANA